MNKILKKTFDIIFILMIIQLSVYFILKIFGVAEIFVVKTGSMEDGIHTGDYIFVIKNTSYNVGDVITFREEDYYVTHRIIEKVENKYITKGDANNTPDDGIDEKDIIGKVVYNGGLLNLAIDNKIAISCGLLGLYLLGIFFEEKEKKTKNEGSIV